MHRLGEVGAALIMMSQLVQTIVQLRGEDRLQGESRPLVQELAALYQDQVVGDLLRQCVLENVLDIAGGRLLVDKLRQLKVGEHPLQVVVPFGCHLSHQAERELPAQNRERLQQILLFRRQAIDACGKDRLHGGRYFQLAERLGQSGRAVAHEGAFVEEHLHRLFHEEWVAFGALDDEAFESIDVVVVLRPHPSGGLKVAGRPLPACAWPLRRRRGRGAQQR
jgi:hypothetical protein